MTTAEERQGGEQSLAFNQWFVAEGEGGWYVCCRREDRTSDNLGPFVRPEANRVLPHMKKLEEARSNLANERNVYKHDFEDMCAERNALIAGVERLTMSLKKTAACGVCWTTSWEPVEREQDCVFAEHPHPEEGHMRCGVCSLIAARDQAEAQRDAAVGLLGTIRDDLEVQRKALDEFGGDLSIRMSLSSVLKHIVTRRVPTFLARVSTVTPEDWEKHQRERAQNAGKSEQEMRERYGLDCERISVCCDGILTNPASCTKCMGEYAQERCATHDKPWGECKEKVW